MNGRQSLPVLRHPTAVLRRLNSPQRAQIFFAPPLHNFAIFTVQLRAMLSVNNVSMRYGARVLFEDVTCTFMAGRRYAISGPNGAGKSTLMKILTGEIEPTNGNVSRPKRFGVLRQDQFAFDDSRVIDTVIM